MFTLNCHADTSLSCNSSKLNEIKFQTFTGTASASRITVPRKQIQMFFTRVNFRTVFSLLQFKSEPNNDRSVNVSPEMTITLMVKAIPSETEENATILKDAATHHHHKHNQSHKHHIKNKHNQIYTYTND